MTDVQLFSPEAILDPYPTFKTLRDEAPVYFAPEMNVHIVTRYDLVREALTRAKDFSSKFDAFLGGAQEMMFATFTDEEKEQAGKILAQMVDLPPTMLTLDEPEHTQFRSLVQELFTASQIRNSEGDVRRVVDKCIGNLIGKTEVEYMKEFAFPLPLQIISERLGIPEADREFFYDAATAAAGALKMTPLPVEEQLRRMQLGVDLQQLHIRLAQERREDPRQDMITILANAQLGEDKRALSDGELVSILNQFLVAGHETTTSTFGWGMLELCRNPELAGQIRGNDKLIKTFVEEVLRIEAPVQGLPRRVTRDTELGGYALSEGSMIMLRFGAANRDERQFEAPDSVNVERKKSGAHMSFGSGIHHCIGAPLARQELNMGFAALLDHFDNFSLAADTPTAEPSIILRGLGELPIRYQSL